MNNLPKFSINNYQFVLIIFITLLLAGVNSFMTMPRTEDPPVAQPGALVTIIYPGATPNDMEELVVNPLEEKINGLEQISEIRGTSGDGYALINVTFEYGNYDFDDKYDDVVQQVNSAKSELPDGIHDIKFQKKTTTDTKIFQLAISSETEEFVSMLKKAEDLERKLEQVKGIKAVEVIAVPDRQVKIQMNMDKMVNMGISLENIANAINANNQNIPGGEVNIGANSYNIKTSGSYNSLQEIRNTVVGSVQGQLVYVKDIATVEFEYEYNSYLADFNGQRSIFITAEQKEGTNVLEIAEKANVIINKFKKNLPKTTQLYYVHNQAESVTSSVNGFIMNLLQGIILVGLVVMMAIGFRSSMVIIIAIPSSIMIGLGFVDIGAGLGLQNVSIAALVIALGLLVDNSIVVTENAERLMRLGLSSRDAAIKGTKQVAYAIISSTLTTLAAFIPIALLPDAAGDFIKSMPITVIATLSVSVILALTISPIFISKFLKVKQGEIPKEKALKRMLRKVIEGPYKRILHYSLTHTRTILVIAILTFLSSVVIFQFVGTSFFPKAEKPVFMVQVTLPQGKNLEETKRVTTHVKTVLDTIPEIKHYATNIGHGNPKVFFNLFPKQNAKNFAEFYVVLHEYEEEKFDNLVNRLRNTFDDFLEADIKIKQLQQGQPIQYPIEIILNGDNLDQLITVSNDIEVILSKQEGVININNELDGTRTDLYVNINKDKASMLGVPISSIDKTIRTAMNGTAISQFRSSNGDEYDIVLCLPIENRAKIEDFDKIYVSSMLGEQIPLSQLARIEFTKSPSKITHYNLQRSAVIGGDVATGYNTAEITEMVKSQIEAYDMPIEVEYEIAGELKQQSSTFGGLGAAAGVALLIIMAILVLQFRSFRQPFIIFAAIPLALTGSFYALFITGYDFSFTGFIGAVALIGIAINNAIILIDFTNEARKEGKSIHDALMEAGQVRFTPIIITSFTTIGGLLPLTLQGGAFWGPLGWTIIGGLMLSTFLVLIVIPVLYKIISK